MKTPGILFAMLLFSAEGLPQQIVEARPTVYSHLLDPTLYPDYTRRPSRVPTWATFANLGGWFRALRPHDDVARRVSQGDEVHRPSTLFLTVKAGAVSVGGDVAEPARGTLALQALP